MGESKIKFGDKIFLYGQFIKYIDCIDECEYNSVIGYITTGGYIVNAVEFDSVFNACITGFISDMLYDDNLEVRSPFNNFKMVDVTNKLSLQTPLLNGSKVWMPIQ